MLPSLLSDSPCSLNVRTILVLNGSGAISQLHRLRTAWQSSAAVIIWYYNGELIKYPLFKVIIPCLACILCLNLLILHSREAVSRLCLKEKLTNYSWVAWANCTNKNISIIVLNMLDFLNYLDFLKVIYGNLLNTVSCKYKVHN